MTTDDEARRAWHLRYRRNARLEDIASDLGKPVEDVPELILLGGELRRAAPAIRRANLMQYRNDERTPS